jgi:transcription elongation factor Elf1
METGDLISVVCNSCGRKRMTLRRDIWEGVIFTLDCIDCVCDKWNQLGRKAEERDARARAETARKAEEAAGEARTGGPIRLVRKAA